MEERCPRNRPSNASFFALIVAIQRQFVTGLEKDRFCGQKGRTPLEQGRIKVISSLSQVREEGVCTRLERNYNRGQGRHILRPPFSSRPNTNHATLPSRCFINSSLAQPCCATFFFPPFFFFFFYFSFFFLSPFSKGLYIPSLRPALNMQHARHRKHTYTRVYTGNV